MSGVLKKIFFVLLAIFLCLVLVAVIVPLFVNVDKYRPRIEEIADQHLNGKLELGHLSLSLWGHIRVEVDGLKVTDDRGAEVLGVKEGYFYLPFSSILGGEPSLILSLDQPSVDVIKSRDGKLNVLSLVRTSPATPAAPNQPSQAQTPESKNVTLPSIVTRSSLGMELKDAILNYRDETSGMSTQLKDLYANLRNISLSREMSVLVTAKLNTVMQSAPKKGEPAGPPTVVVGLARLTAQAKPSVVSGRFDHVSVTSHLDLDDLDISMGPVFHKQKGMPMNADLSLTASESAIQVERLVARFFDAELNAQGSITHPAPTLPGGASQSMVDLTLKSNTIELKPWSQLVPMLADYDLGGTAELSAEAHGPSEKLGYKALARVNGLSAKAPHLKAVPRIDALLSVVTDQIDNLTVTMKAPGNDLKIQGKVVSFTSPNASFQVTSSGMDLDQLIEFPAPGQPAGAQGQARSSAPVSEEAKTAAPPANYDAELDSLRSNPTLARTTAKVDLNMRLLKVKGIAISDIVGKLTLKDLVAGLEGFGMKVWGGAIGANSRVQLRPEMPVYRFDTKVSGLELQQAVASEMHLFRNTLLGTASFEMTGSGSSFNPTPALRNLDAKGKVRVDNAVFASIDVGRMVSEALNGAIDRISARIPALKGKTVGALPQGKSRYDSISTDFTISGGKFVAPDFVAKAALKQGIDLKGSVTVGLLDDSLRTDWEVIDTYNLTHARDLSVTIGGVPVNHILAPKNQPVQFPVSAGCNLKAPCYSYTQVPEALAKVALGNMTGAGKSRVQAELQKRAESLIKQAPPNVQNQLQNLSKKLFGQ